MTSTIAQRIDAARDPATPWTMLAQLLLEFPDEVISNPAFVAPLEANPSSLTNVPRLGLALLAARPEIGPLGKVLPTLPAVLAELRCDRNERLVGSLAPSGVWIVESEPEFGEGLRRNVIAACRLLQVLGPRQVKWSHARNWMAGLAESDFADETDDDEEYDDAEFDEPQQRVMSEASSLDIDGSRRSDPKSGFDRLIFEALETEVPGTPGTMTLEVDIAHGRASFAYVARTEVADAQALTLDGGTPVDSETDVAVELPTGQQRPPGITLLEQALCRRSNATTAVLVQLTNGAMLYSGMGRDWRTLGGDLLRPTVLSRQFFESLANEFALLQGVDHVKHGFDATYLDESSVAELWAEAEIAADQACSVGMANGSRVIAEMAREYRQRSVMAMTVGRIGYLAPPSRRWLELEGKHLSMTLKRI
jgi:hypothetical protein